MMMANGDCGDDDERGRAARGMKFVWNSESKRVEEYTNRRVKEYKNRVK